jgi:hypothetical protein
MHAPELDRRFEFFRLSQSASVKDECHDYSAMISMATSITHQ